MPASSQQPAVLLQLDMPLSQIVIQTKFGDSVENILGVSSVGLLVTALFGPLLIHAESTMLCGLYHSLELIVEPLEPVQTLTNGFRHCSAANGPLNPMEFQHFHSREPLHMRLSVTPLPPHT